MEYDLTQLRRIDLIDQQSLVRCLSPELMLVDPELARRARELLHEPGESNGKGNMSTVLGTHEMSSGIVLGLEPPLSPPVVHGPSAMAAAGPSAPGDLPAPPAPAIAPPTEDHLEVPEQPLAPPPPAEPPLPEIQVLPPPAPVEERIELPAVESLTPPAPEPPAAEEPTIEPAFELPVNGSQPGAFRVVVRLSDGDGVEVGEFRDFGTAMQGAQEVIDQFSHSNGSWPFYAGRFIRPDLIISVDVVDGAAS